MAATVWDLSLPALLFALGVVVAGGVVRGFGGFGGAMVWVAGLVVLLPPTSVIPTVFVVEVVASAAMLPPGVAAGALEVVALVVRRHPDRYAAGDVGAHAAVR